MQGVVRDKTQLTPLALIVRLLRGTRYRSLLSNWQPSQVSEIV